MPKERPIPVSRKRLVRVSGFICGILAGWLVNSSHLVFILAIVAILTILILNTRWKRSSAWFNWNGCWYSDRFGWIMLLHQIHYFAYAYVLLSILLITPTIPQSRTIWLHPVTAALWFSSGWLSYISGEWLLRDRFELSARQASIVGHTWVAICLVGMIFLRDYTSALAAVWVIGGFGGGSVYAIKELAKSASSRIDIELWEHWGHVMGVALALVSVVIWPCYLEIPFIIALGAALSTLFLLVLQDVQIRIPG
ncbi:MAG: hypothetical protein HOC20_14605 [Chloroflexi bacterium]|nr:hypothetical protein [Chloroflexota bacterium]